MRASSTQRVLDVTGGDRLADRLHHGQRIGALPPEMRGVEVHGDRRADRRSQPQEGGHVVDHVRGVRLDAQHHAMGVGDLRGFGPIGQHALLPLPAVRLTEPGKRRVDHPVGSHVARPAGGQAGQQAHVSYAELRGQPARRHEVLVVGGGAGRLRVQRVAVARERAEPQLAFLEGGVEALRRVPVVDESDRVVVQRGNVPAGARLDLADAAGHGGVQHRLPRPVQHARGHQGQLHPQQSRAAA